MEKPSGPLDNETAIKQMVEFTLRNRSARFKRLGFPEFTKEEIEERRIKIDNANAEVAEFERTHHSG
jgi:hypothetical protein